ncbi:MAG: hypothetical protein Q9M39_00625 [Sulfurovum sp.]|nr:hypothetical protein [Sulfurovum sp.]
MNLKDKIDLLVNRADLIYKKLFIFLAISGGSWVYGRKDKEKTIVRIAVFFIFILSSFGIIVNLLKFGKIQKELEGITDD